MDKRDGLAEMLYPNGDILRGSWTNDLLHGQGKLRIALSEEQDENLTWLSLIYLQRGHHKPSWKSPA